MRERLVMTVAVALALFPTLFAHALFPSLHLNYLAPLLVWLYYTLPLRGALWMSLGAGLLIDLLSSSHSMGSYALLYCTTTWILYRAKPRFYQGGWMTVAILTAGFSVIAALLEALLFALTSSSEPLTLRWVATELLLLPLIGAIWAFFGFALPVRLLQQRRRIQQPIRLARPR